MKRSKQPGEVLKGTAPGLPSALPPVAASAEDMFRDRRSGRDRRDLGGSSEVSAREKSDRRIGIGAVGRSVLTNGAWWLQRGYVDSHHFVENATTFPPVGWPGVAG